MDAENEKQRPIMLHRAIFGSIERFFGILLENYAGAFPLWLAPVQVSPYWGLSLAKATQRVVCEMGSDGEGLAIASTIKGCLFTCPKA